MARGQISKTKITNKILETFEGSFLCNGGKEIRIPYQEDGETIQIKVSLTAAKDNVAADGSSIASSPQDEKLDWGEPKEIKISQEEKDNVMNLAKMLNL